MRLRRHRGNVPDSSDTIIPSDSIIRQSQDSAPEVVATSTGQVWQVTCMEGLAAKRANLAERFPPDAAPLDAQPIASAEIGLDAKLWHAINQQSSHRR